jgi:hypothetical protein
MIVKLFLLSPIAIDCVFRFALGRVYVFITLVLLSLSMICIYMMWD